MKKFITTIIAVALLGTGAAFAAADDNNPGDAVMASFKKDYAAATQVIWQNLDNLTQVSFTLGGRQLYAFYDADGERVGTATYISSSRLPFALVQKIENEYKGYNVNDQVIEFNTPYGTHYYVKVYNSKKQITLKSDTEGSLHVVKKEKL
jgi:uncharacterized protein YxeA